MIFELQDVGESAALPRGVRLHALLDHAGSLHCRPGDCGDLLKVAANVHSFMSNSYSNIFRAGAEFELSLIWALVVAGLIAFTLQV